MPHGVIFTGPTLPLSAVAQKLGAPRDGCFHLAGGSTLALLPPVAEGDIAALVSLKPSVIAIVDGYFENTPAVWHKEILYAMAQGIHVMGASSMGALRAAELAAFGMKGVGHIYEAYAAGRWEDDDEVTVAHGPAELGFPAVSEAMANIRATFDHALATGTIALPEWVSLTAIAKAIFYKNRTYTEVLRIAATQGMAQARVAELQSWLAANRRDQKLLDALDLLDLVTGHLQSDAGKKQVLYTFEDTIIWRRARNLSQDLNLSA